MKITCTLDTTTHKVVPIELINAIEKLVKCRGRYHTQQNFELLQSAFAKHQAAPPYPADTNIVETLDSWISVNDRMPEPFQMVYAFVPLRASNPFSTAIMRYSNSYKSEGYKFLFDGIEIDDDIVTHWMPLPAAPKGNE